jgi:mannose-1-phosphate guanylyltransferase
MKCLLLAAGFGVRLRPLTDHVPKCLVELQGRPLLDWWLRSLHEAGIREFRINTHYLPGQVERFVASHPLSSCISLVHEPTLLGTAGTVFANRSLFASGTVLLAHADNLCLCSWLDFFAAHAARPPHTLMTMMTFQTKNPHECGIVELDDHGVMVDFHEKVAAPPGNLANAAVYLIEPELLHEMERIDPAMTDLSTQLLPMLKGRIFTWLNPNILIDIGSHQRLDEARRLLAAC